MFRLQKILQDVKINHTLFTCPTCGVPSKEPIGNNINRIASLGARLTDIKNAKKNPNVLLEEKDIIEELVGLGCWFDKDGFIHART